MDVMDFDQLYTTIFVHYILCMYISPKIHVDVTRNKMISIFQTRICILLIEPLSRNKKQFIRICCTFKWSKLKCTSRSVQLLPKDRQRNLPIRTNAGEESFEQSIPTATRTCCIPSTLREICVLEQVVFISSFLGMLSL